MSSSRRKHFRETRKSRLRELKRSRTGVVGMVSSLAAALFFACAVVLSAVQSGAAGFEAGTLGLLGLVLACGGFALGILAIREPKVRPAAPRTAIALGCVLMLALVLFYVYGFLVQQGIF